MDSPLPLDAATPAEARDVLARCCGSARWVERMLTRRPFGTLDALLRAAREEWFALSEPEWREAFSHHPMIGDREALRARFARTRDLSSREQAGVDHAPDDVLDALAKANREYFEKFGYIFIVCASGLSADEMLARLQTRLDNDPETEIRLAAGEHAKITGLRLRNHT
jgi:2-oxo-4-hydroxy-4-carboxy-5-ureidoimidazoline decarboxylase